MSFLWMLLGCFEQKEYVDIDGDGYSSGVDCDDYNYQTYPDAPEACDGFDNNCNGEIDENLPLLTLYPDNDGDGFGGLNTIEHCRQVENHIFVGGDCDDSNPNIHPNSTEICDGIDNDCDNSLDEDALDRQTFYADNDGDGFGSNQAPIQACDLPIGYVNDHQDCDDTDAAIHPNAIEICDEKDNDCDYLIDDEDDSLDPVTATPYYQDNDHDGFGDLSTEVLTCTQPGDYVDNGLDCDDSNMWNAPSVYYDSCDGMDNDCDGDVDEDVKAGWPLVTIHEWLGGMSEIDTTTGQINITHPLTGIGSVYSMDVSESGLAAIHSNYGGARIAFLDACNNQVTFLPPHNTSGIGCGISFGPNGRLYAINSSNDSLYEINTTTGQATLVGQLGVDIENCGIAYDCVHDVLVGATSSTDQIFKIDHQTGLAYDFIQTTVPLTISVGMEFDASSNSAYLATEIDLYRVDMSTGLSTYVGSTGGDPSWNINDLAFHPPCP